MIERDAGLLGVHAANPDCPVGREIQHTLTAIDSRVARAVQHELDRITVVDLMPAGAEPLRQRLLRV